MTDIYDKSYYMLIGTFIFVLGFSLASISVWLEDGFHWPFQQEKTTQLNEDFANATVYIKSNNTLLLNTLFKGSLNEVSFCLFGRVESNGSAIFIENIREAPMETRRPDTVTYITCGGKGYLGTMHTHPEGTDRFSLQDAFSMGQSKDVIRGVVYGEDKYLFYGASNNLLELVNFEIN